MKRTQLSHPLLALLMVIVSIIGCGRVPPSTIDDVPVAVANHADEIAQALGLARQYRNQAQQLADDALRAKNFNEILRLNEEAAAAAQNARRQAERAEDLQSLIDDIAQKNRVSDDVQRTLEAADQAVEYQASINRLLQLMQDVHKQSIRSSVDTVTETIWQAVSYTGDASEEQAIQWMKEIVAGSYCDLLVDVVITQEPPTVEAVREALGENALKVGLDITRISDMATNQVLKGFQQLTSDKPEQLLEQLKDACGQVLKEL